MAARCVRRTTSTSCIIVLSSNGVSTGKAPLRLGGGCANSFVAVCGPSARGVRGLNLERRTIPNNIQLFIGSATRTARLVVGGPRLFASCRVGGNSVSSIFLGIANGGLAKNDRGSKILWFGNTGLRTLFWERKHFFRVTSGTTCFTYSLYCVFNGNLWGRLCYKSSTEGSSFQGTSGHHHQQTTYGLTFNNRLHCHDVLLRCSFHTKRNRQHGIKFGHFPYWGVRRYSGLLRNGTSFRASDLPTYGHSLPCLSQRGQLMFGYGKRYTYNT